MTDLAIDDCIKAACTAVLELPNIAGQCLGASAALSEMLSKDRIENYVAIGSLACKGTETFTYCGNLPTPYAVGAEPMKGDWDGHAWVVVKDNFLIDPSLIRTARGLSNQSNIKKYIEAKGWINKGALGFPINNTEELLYNECERLPQDLYDPVIQGLVQLNADFLDKSQ